MVIYFASLILGENMVMKNYIMTIFSAIKLDITIWLDIYKWISQEKYNAKNMAALK